MNRIVRWGCFLAGLAWIFLATNKFVNFGYHDWDLALYAQAMQRMVHGSLCPSLFGMNFLGNHAEYISFMLVPVYAVFSHPLTLVAVNITGFSVAAYLLYRIARRVTTLPVAAALTSLYLIHPANVFMLSYEFHFESLAIPFLMAMFLFYLKKKFVPFMIAGVLACLCKEHLPAVLVMFGVAAIFAGDRDRRQWALVPILTGGVYFLLVMFVLIPWARSGLVQQGSIYWGLLPQLAEHQASGPIAIMSKVQTLAVQLVSPINVRYARDVFLPLACVPLLGGWPLLMALPFLGFALFASTWTYHTIYYHYAATMLPCIFVAAALGFGALEQRLRPKALAVIMAICVAFSFLGLQRYQEQILSRLKIVRGPADDSRAALTALVPPGVPVVASFSFLSHLTEHKELYAFYNVWTGWNYFRGEAFVLPSHVRWAIVDMEDPWLLGAKENDPEGTAARLKTFFDRGWIVKARVGSLFLLQRHPDPPPAGKALSVKRWDPSLRSG